MGIHGRPVAKGFECKTRKWRTTWKTAVKMKWTPWLHSDVITGLRHHRKTLISTHSIHRGISYSLL